MDDLNVDPNLLAEFIDEAVEGLETLPNIFIELEKKPENLQLINDIFRPVHTIKGNSAFFGLMDVKALTHEAETLLDKLRKGLIAVSSEIISVLIESTELVSQMLANVRAGEKEVSDLDAFEKMVDKLKGLSAEEVAPDQLIRKFLVDAQVFADSAEITDKGKDDFKKLLSVFKNFKAVDSKTSGASNAIIAQIKENLGFAKGGKLEENKHQKFKTHLSELKNICTSGELKKVFDEMEDQYLTMFPVVGFDDILLDLINDGLSKLEPLISISIGEEKKKEEKASIPPPKEEKKVDKKEPSAEVSEKSSVVDKTMRIPEGKIDSFLSNVGELIVVREMFEHLRKKLIDEISNAKLLEEFRRMTESFSLLTFNLEDSVMAIRKQSIASIFRKSPKIVRDVCQKNGKKVEVILEGEDIDVDKSLLGILEGPLVHMVRNSADHGIELPEDRIAKKKKETGIIKVSMQELETTLLMTVADDGKGLDLDAIRKKAVEVGLIKGDQALTEKEIVDLLFMSGVSTAKEVTDVSGRGVGMDVVKRNIDEVGGKISVGSEKNVGTTFSVELPKSITTQILNGFIVRVAENYFVFPVSKIVESFPPDEKFIFKRDQENVVKRYDDIYTIANLHQEFHLADTEEDQIFVVAEDGGAKKAFKVNELLGIQQVVLKPLDGLKFKKKLFQGGALMGDGSIALILDLKAFFERE